MSLNVANCPKCGKIYTRNIREVCNNCYKEVELMYEKCLKYLREYRKCTLQELSDATEVSTGQIIKFIREGRISVVLAPNLAFPCEMCGDNIQVGTICENCRKKLAKELNSAAPSTESRNILNQKAGFTYKRDH
ncbi:flagellar protein [Paenibacillus gansuensis]|uniref:Flagellar protein n=1 Tax=Paenibacillus gansuensis TaxID=306542 RepID=A0ABW5PL71_9BACL